MSSVTVNISFQEQLLADIDRVAKRESRSRSELVREATRMYVERKERWDSIFALGKRVAAAKELTANDIAQEIRAHRKAKRQ